MTQSGEDVRERYNTRLGTEFGAILHELWSAWVWGLMRQEEFRELVTPAEDVSLSNSLTGGGFDWSMHNVLWEDLILRVCRLTDCPKTQARTTSQWLDCLRSASNRVQQGPALYERIQQLVDTADRKAELARDSRNRCISDSDLERGVGKGDPLAKASLGKVTNVLDAVHGVLNTISDELLQEKIPNSIAAGPEAEDFLCDNRHLINSVKLVDARVVEAGRNLLGEITVESRATKARLLAASCQPAPMFKLASSCP